MKPSITTLPKASKETGFPYAELLSAAKEGRLRTIRPEGRRSYLVDMGDVLAFIEGLKSGSNAGSEGQDEPPQVAINKESRKRTIFTPTQAKYGWIERFTK